MKTKLIAGLLAVLLILTIGGCKSMENAYEKAAGTSFKVSVLKGPTAAGLIKAMEPEIRPSLKLGDTVTYTIEQNSDELYTRLLAGEIEIAAIPTDMAARLCNSSDKYQLAAVNSGGFLYVISDDAGIDHWADLRGKEVQIAEEGSASDIAFRYLLSQNGIDPDKDLTLHYITDSEELAQMTINGDIEIAVLPEPWVSIVLNRNSNLKIALDLPKEWTRIHGAENPFAQTCLVVNAELPARNLEALSLFLEDYKNSIDWVNKNIGKTAELASGHDIGMPPEIAADAIPRCNLLYLSAKEAKPAVEKYLQILLDSSPDIIGGELPDVKFYYQ